MLFAVCENVFVKKYVEIAFHGILCSHVKLLLKPRGKIYTSSAIF